METFDYAAFDKAGERKTGSISAETPREARDLLRAQSLLPVELTAARAKPAGFFNRERKPGHKELTQATRQMAILIDAATPVEEALHVTASQFERSPMRQVLLDCRARIMEGERLSEAMRAHPRAFSQLYAAMIASGETSGRLPMVLDRLASDLEASRRIRQKIMAATAYPVVLTFVALFVVALLMVLVVPRVVEQFDTFGQELPLLTRFVIGLSNLLQSWGLLILAGCGIASFAFYRTVQNPEFRLKWHGFILKLPLIGRLGRDLNAARFARTMAGLINSGTQSLVAMETAQHTLRNTVMFNAVTAASARVREGAPMSQALRQTGVFPMLVTQMVAGGEASGKVGLMFEKSATYLEEEFESTTAVFLNLLEPLIIILMSVMVLLIIGAIFLPILQLNTLAF